VTFSLHLPNAIFINSLLTTLVDTLDLSRFRAAPITHLSDLTFEGQGAFPAQG